MSTFAPAAETERRLAALAEYGILDSPAEAGFDDIVLVASHACAVPIALVSLVERDRQWFKAKVGLEACETPIGQSICAHALGSPNLLVIPDLTADPRTRDNPLVVGDPAIRFYAGAPLVLPTGVIIGTLCVIDMIVRPGGLTDAQEHSLEALARQVVSQLELRKLLMERSAAYERQMRAGIASLAQAIAISEDENASLRANDLRLVSAQEAGGVGTMEIDVESGLMRVSAEFCRLFGLPIAPDYPVSALEKLILREDDAMRSTPQERREGSAALDVEYRVRRADDGRVRWIGRRARFIRDANGKVVTMLGTVQDVTDRRRLQQHQAALLELGDRFREHETPDEIAAAAAMILGRTLTASGAGCGTLVRDGTALVVNGDWATHGGAKLVGEYPFGEEKGLAKSLRQGHDLVVTDIETDPMTAGSLDRLRAAGARALISLPIMEHGRWVGLLFVNDRVPRTWTEDEVEFARAVADRTKAALDKLRAEAEQRVLNQELSHRLKNTLAMVQAIASQTLRCIAEREPVLAFEKRLHALGTAHDVLLQESWSSASMKAVVTAVLGTFGQPARFAVSGPDITLSPRATMSLSLLLHELATNAFKYGALTIEGGLVKIGWRQEGAGHDANVIFTWEETGGPPTEEPKSKGFGSRLIRMGLVGTGGVTLRYLPTGLNAEMSAPLNQLQQP